LFCLWSIQTEKFIQKKIKIKIKIENKSIVEIRYI
jgi:hypothetical protein